MQTANMLDLSKGAVGSRLFRSFWVVEICTKYTKPEEGCMPIG